MAGQPHGPKMTKRSSLRRRRRTACYCSQLAKMGPSPGRPWGQVVTPRRPHAQVGQSRCPRVLPSRRRRRRCYRAAHALGQGRQLLAATGRIDFQLPARRGREALQPSCSQAAARSTNSPPYGLSSSCLRPSHSRQLQMARAERYCRSSLAAAARRCSDHCATRSWQVWVVQADTGRAGTS